MPYPVPSIRSLIVFAACLMFSGTAEAARGRPHINATGTTFVTDNGELLRGAITGTNFSLMPNIKAVGLNTIHLYAESWGQGYNVGAKVAAVDEAVRVARDNDLYLVITIGGGGVNADFNAAFWRIYAPRYANSPHVIYEIQNEPAANNPPYSGSSAVMNLQVDAYDIIRAAAPLTPVLFMSYSSFENGAGVLTDINALNTLSASRNNPIDWSNAGIAFHGYGEKGPAAIRTCLETVLNAGYACMQTEFYRWPWGLGDFSLAADPSLYQDVDETGDLERLGVSWLSFLRVTIVTTNTRFKDRLNNAGVVWTPDFGSWPVPGRSVYGNGGEPRTAALSTTVRIQAEDFDNGGQSVAYNDLTTTNSGNAYRTTEGVDIQTTTDTGGGYNIGWISSGEWLEYTTLIRSAGLYTISLRVASPQATNSVRATFAGVDVTGSWTFSGTGANQTWTTISKTVSLVPGQQRLRLTALSSGLNLNWIELAPAASGILADGTYRILSRSTGKAVGVVNASTSNGAKIEQLGYTAATNQLWRFTHRGANQYTITSAQTGKGIDEAAGNSLSGDTLGMWGVSGAGSDGQRWIPTATGTGHYTLVNARTGLAMGVADASTVDGARIDVAEYTTGAYQQWAVTAPVLVSIAATDADAGGVEGNTGQFAVTRDVAQSTTLVVPLSRSGTAASGTDFVAIPTSVTIPADATSVSFTVSPVSGQLPTEDKTVIVSPTANSAYGIGTSPSATVTIHARDAFAQWTANNLTIAERSDSAFASMTAAPFGDGIPNLIRAALNLGRTSSASASLPIAASDRRLSHARLPPALRRPRHSQASITPSAACLTWSKPAPTSPPTPGSPAPRSSSRSAPPRPSTPPRNSSPCASRLHWPGSPVHSSACASCVIKVAWAARPWFGNIGGPPMPLQSRRYTSRARRHQVLMLAFGREIARGFAELPDAIEEDATRHFRDAILTARQHADEEVARGASHIMRSLEDARMLDVGFLQTRRDVGDVFGHAVTRFGEPVENVAVNDEHGVEPVGFDPFEEELAIGIGKRGRGFFQLQDGKIVLPFSGEGRRAISRSPELVHAFADFVPRDEAWSAITEVIQLPHAVLHVFVVRRGDAVDRRTRQRVAECDRREIFKREADAAAMRGQRTDEQSANAAALQDLRGAAAVHLGLAKPEIFQEVTVAGQRLGGTQPVKLERLHHPFVAGGKISNPTDGAVIKGWTRGDAIRAQCREHRVGHVAHLLRDLLDASERFGLHARIVLHRAGGSGQMNPRLDRDISKNNPFFLHAPDGISIRRAVGNLM
jgi:endoglucanase